MKYLAIPSPDGLRLEEVNPYPKYIFDHVSCTTGLNQDWHDFENSKRSFLTDDPRVVVGQQYPAEEYELVWQTSRKRLNGNVWIDASQRTIENISKNPADFGWDTRQILRRKAESGGRESNLPDIELVAAKVHDAWWDAKKENGFHAPRDCESENRRGYTQSARQNQERFDDHFNEKFYKWCDKCHPDMYPYNDLSETVKDYDRTTVKAVYQAINELKNI